MRNTMGFYILDKDKKVVVAPDLVRWSLLQ